MKGLSVHVVVMGCGRVGSTLAHSLSDRGHSVAIIDQNPAAFRRLASHFTGRRIVGIGFDREILRQAGIEHAAALAAVSNGDNSNILTARVARETFSVANVVARIYDPRRAEVYQRLGIPTVGTVRWTASQIMRWLLPDGAELLWCDPSDTVRLAQVPVNPAWIGRQVTELEKSSGVRIAFVTRLGEGVIPDLHTVIQENDLIHVVMRKADTSRITEIFATIPEES